MNDNLNTEIENDAQENQTDADASVENTSDNADSGKSEGELQAINQEQANHAFIKKNKELQEAKDRADEEGRKRQELETKLAAFEKKQRPEIPELPDEFDDNRDQKIAARDTAIREQEAFDQKEKFILDQQQQTLQQNQAQKMERINGVVTSFDKRAGEIGLDAKKVEESKDIVSRFIAPIIAQNPLAADMVEEVMADPDGPLIFEHLKNNPMELDKIGAMTPTRAAVYIETKVKPQAQKLKPETTKTPDPLDIPNGKGAPSVNDNDKYMSGGQFID